MNNHSCFIYESSLFSRMNQRYIIPNLKKACQVLKALSSGDTGFTLFELARNLNLG